MTQVLRIAVSREGGPDRPHPDNKRDHITVSSGDRTRNDASRHPARSEPIDFKSEIDFFDDFRNLVEGMVAEAGMARTFEAKPARPSAPRAVQPPATAIRAVPPVADFARLANRLHVGAPVQRREAVGPGHDFSGIAGPGRPPVSGGLPAGLRADVEARSGLRMDDVRVHRHSDKPARIGALAYAQGRDIHLGPGQERHLAHEAWHVVQQKQGRVRPTQQVKGVDINDEPQLESEADSAMSKHFEDVGRKRPRPWSITTSDVIQKFSETTRSIIAHAANDRPHVLGWAGLFVSVVSSALEEAHLEHRFGGSLAANLRGARRAPNDIDVEVQNEADVERARDALSIVNNKTYPYNGNIFRVSTRALGFKDGLYAGVKLILTDNSGSEKEIDIDISNENAPAFVTGMISPQMRGIKSDMGDLLSSQELVMNYISRIVQKPTVSVQKGDAIQIVDILRAEGFNPSNRDHIDILKKAVEAHFLVESVPLALRILEQVISEAIKKSFGGT